MAACAIGVVCCVAAICVWHFAHSAVPTNLSREAADLVGHQPGEERWSSVASETFVADGSDELEELALDAAGALRAVR